MKKFLNFSALTLGLLFCSIIGYTTAKASPVDPFADSSNVVEVNALDNSTYTLDSSNYCTSLGGLQESYSAWKCEWIPYHGGVFQLQEQRFVGQTGDTAVNNASYIYFGNTVGEKGYFKSINGADGNRDIWHNGQVLMVSINGTDYEGCEMNTSPDIFGVKFNQTSGNFDIFCGDPDDPDGINYVRHTVTIPNDGSGNTARFFADKNSANLLDADLYGFLHTSDYRTLAETITYREWFFQEFGFDGLPINEDDPTPPDPANYQTFGRAVTPEISIGEDNIVWNTYPLQINAGIPDLVTDIDDLTIKGGCYEYAILPEGSQDLQYEGVFMSINFGKYIDSTIPSGNIQVWTKCSTETDQISEDITLANSWKLIESTDFTGSEYLDTSFSIQTKTCAPTENMHIIATLNTCNSFVENEKVQLKVKFLNTTSATNRMPVRPITTPIDSGCPFDNALACVGWDSAMVSIQWLSEYILDWYLSIFSMMFGTLDFWNITPDTEYCTSFGGNSSCVTYEPQTEHSLIDFCVYLGLFSLITRKIFTDLFSTSSNV